MAKKCGKLLRRAFACLLVVVMTLTAVPMSGFVGLELPKWSELFATKASAADILSPEEAVDIYMKNKSVWYHSETYMDTADYFFIDLDFDNCLELVFSWYTGGSGYITQNEYYKIDTSSMKVYKVEEKLNGYSSSFGDEIDYDRGVSLYSDKTRSKKFYVGVDLARAGWTFSASFTRTLSYIDRLLTANALFDATVTTSESDYKETHEYFDYTSGKKVKLTESQYNINRKKYFDSLVDLSLKTKKVKLYNKTISEQKKLLLESYRAFSYDGYKAFDFVNDVNNVYLGTNANENNVKGVSLTFKGTTEEVKKFTTSRIKKWEIEDTSIVKYKSCELAPTVGINPTEVVVTAYLEAKKEGETTFTATLDDGTTTKCKIVVKRPNELKMGISDVGTYYAIDNVFFDEYGNFSSGALKIDAFLQNKIKDEITKQITDREALKKLTEKELKINLSLNSIGLSLEPDVYTQKKEIILEKEKEDLVPYDEPLERKFCIYLLSQEVIDSLEEIPCTLTVRLSTLNSAGEYEEKVKSEIKFTLKSYKKQYINEHITALQSDGLYRSKVISNSVAVTMDGLENKLQYKYFQYLKKGLVKTLADCVTDFTDVNAYQVILADYISTINSPDNIEKMALDYVGKEALSTGKRILNIILDFAKRFYTDDALEKVQKQISNGDVTIDAVKDVMSGKTTSGPVYDIMQDMMKTSSGAKALDGALFVNNMVGDVMKKYGYVADTVNAAIETYNVVCSLNAYLDIQQEQKQVFVELRDQARADGNIPLAKALDDYIQYDSDVGFSKFSDSLIAAARKSGGKFLSQGVTVVTSVFGKKFNEKLVGFLGEKVFNGASSAFAYMTAAIEGGKIISNILGNTDDYADAMGEIVIACGFRKSLFNTVMNLYTQMLTSNAQKDSNGAYLYARELDCALEMLKFAENNTCNKTLDALKSTESSIVINFFQEKKLELKKQISLIQIRQVGLSDAYCHNIYLSELYAKILATSCPEFGFDGTVGDEFEDTPYKTITIQCPVNVFVYKGSTLVTAIENNKVTKSDSKISTLVIGDEKYVCLSTSDSYSVKLVATDGGTMDYSVFEFDAGGQPIRNVSYDAVTLTKDQQFNAAVGKDSIPASSSYNLKTGTNTISPTSDDYVRLTALSFANSSENVYVDSTLALSVNKTPENAKETHFKWESSDPTVAKVNSDGTVTGIKAGTAIITCTSKLDSTVKATVTVTVKACTHSFSAYETVSESTCITYGYQTRTCSVCGKTETKTLATLKPHVPDGETFTIAATCTENAKKFRLCKNCHKTAETIDQPNTALGHAVVIDKAVAATCTKTGLTEGKHCSRCKAVLVARKTVAKKAHTYKTTVTPATTSKDGKAVAACTVCKVVAKTVVIPKIASIGLSSPSYTYDGKVKTPTVTVKNSKGTTLKNGTDYTVAYASGRKMPGQYAVKITFKGNYSGSKVLYFTILPGVTSKIATATNSSAIKIAWKAVPGATGYRVFQYDTKTKKYVTLKTTTGTSYTVTKLKSGTSYKFAVRAYTIVNGKVYWAAGYKTITATTNPGTPTLKAVAGTRKATLSWNKQNGATGYLLYMATSKNGKYTKIATLKGNTKVSYTKTGLTKGRYYYFKVIAYKTVGSTNLYGAYSSVRYVKVK